MAKTRKVAQAVDARPKRKRGCGDMELEFGKRIRARRIEVGMTQTELGARLDISFQQIQKYEKGINRVGVARLIEIAKVLDVEPTFFYGKDSRANKEVESVLLLDSNLGLRLLRSYAKVKDQAVQHSFVIMVEAVADFIGE